MVWFRFLTHPFRTYTLVTSCAPHLGSDHSAWWTPILRFGIHITDSLSPMSPRPPLIQETYCLCAWAESVHQTVHCFTPCRRRQSLASFPTIEYGIYALNAFISLSPCFFMAVLNIGQGFEPLRVTWKILFPHPHSSPSPEVHEPTDRQNSIYDFGSSLSFWSSSIDTWLRICAFLRIWKRIGICICINESLCCTPETNTTL